MDAENWEISSFTVYLCCVHTGGWEMHAFRWKISEAITYCPRYTDLIVDNQVPLQRLSMSTTGEIQSIVYSTDGLGLNLVNHPLHSSRRIRLVIDDTLTGIHNLIKI